MFTKDELQALADRALAESRAQTNDERRASLASLSYAAHQAAIQIGRA
jgi:hypothetical protein